MTEERSIGETTVIIDGDIVAFIAASVEPDDQDRANTRAQELVNEILECNFVSLDDYIICVKGEGNFRNEFPSYKTNRSNSKRPDTLEGVREYLGNLKYGERCNGFEADDAVCAYAQELLEMGKDYVIATIDKDLRQMHGKHYNIKTQKLDYVTEDEADFFLWQQCLMGDSVDGIQGLAGVGKKKSADMLEGVPMGRRQWVVEREYRKRYPECQWRDALHETWNLVYMRRWADDFYVLPLPEEFDE